MYFAEDISLCHKILLFQNVFGEESIFSFLLTHPHIFLQHTYNIVADNRSMAFFIRVDFLLKISKLLPFGERNLEQKTHHSHMLPNHIHVQLCKVTNFSKIFDE